MRVSTISMSLISLLALSACGSSGLFDRDRPDEFAVSRQAPLAIPPDFTLTPPKPGQPRPQDSASQRQTLEALFGGSQKRSGTEGSIINRAGDADAGIRSSVGDPKTFTVDKGGVTRDIIAAPEGDGRSAQSAIPN